ncbi:hypothetical protein, partial [Actinomadura soli]|uniref:hypothetical protein n=1 Tax=Actinomadura soli TaxID=2508997 RepID=UPI00197ACAEE
MCIRERRGRVNESAMFAQGHLGGLFRQIEQPGIRPVDAAWMTTMGCRRPAATDGPSRLAAAARQPDRLRAVTNKGESVEREFN